MSRKLRLVLWVFASAVLAQPAGAEARRAALRAPGSAPLAALQAKYDKPLYQGVVELRARNTPADEHVVGDNTGPFGRHWTKCTNLALDLMVSLVALKKQLISSEQAKTHVGEVLKVLRGLRSFKGIFPETIKLEHGISAEVKDGRIRYSSIDSAWVTLALSLVSHYYRASDAELARSAETLIAQQDYSVFVREDGLLGGGVAIDAASNRIVERFPFGYGDRNSEARPLVLALIGLGKLPASAWDNMHYAWTNFEGLPIARGYHSSAFVELTGQLFFDEMSLAPATLGKSHLNYVSATARVAHKRGHAVWGYAPGCSDREAYAEFGLERPDAVAPYAAAELALTGDARAVANVQKILRMRVWDGTPLPDGLDPKTGAVSCPIARTLDQALLFLALNADSVQALVRRTDWYRSAESRLRKLDSALSDKARPRASEHGRLLVTPDNQRLARAALFTRAAFSGAQSWTSVARDNAEASTPPHAISAIDASPHGSRAALQRLLQEALEGGARAGGDIDVAQARSDLASASAIRAWFDFLPDISLVARRQAQHRTVASFDDAAWQLEMQARAVLSLEKLHAARAAAAEKERERARVRQAEHDTFIAALSAALELYLVERRSAFLRDHRRLLGELATGLHDHPRSGSALDETSLGAHVRELDQELSELAAEQIAARADLERVAGKPLGSSGLRTDTDLPELLDAIDSAAARHFTAQDAIARADLDAQKVRLELAQSRAPYIPELHAGVYATLPQGSPQTGAPGTGFEVDQVTGEFSLAFNLRPGDRSLERSQRAAFEKSRSELDNLRTDLRRARAQAEVELTALRAAWSHTRAAPLARRNFAAVARGFQRGERDFGALDAASRQALASQATEQRVLARALRAAVALSAARVFGTSAPSARRDNSARPISAADADAAEARALRNARTLRAAEADVRRTRALEGALSSPLQISLEAGLLYPLYSRDQALALPSGFVIGGPAALAPQRITERTALLRLNFDLASRAREVQAARAETQLRRAELERARNAVRLEQLEARLAAAYAAVQLRRAEVVARHGNAERTALEQMQAAALLDDPAVPLRTRLDSERALAELEEARGAFLDAQVRYNAALGNSRGTPVAVRESPEELGAALSRDSGRFASVQSVRSDGALRVAELNVRYAEHRLALLREPPHHVRWTLQGTQGLEGRGYSLGIGVSLDLDPPKNSPKIVEAAEQLGQARGELARLRENLVRARRRATENYRAFEALGKTEIQNRDQAERLQTTLRDEQALTPTVHAAAKARERAEFSAELARTDRRITFAEERLTAARVACLALGITSNCSPELDTARRVTLADTQALVSRVAAHDPELLAQTRVTDSVEHEGLRLPVLGGFHLAGPSVASAYNAQRASGQPVLTTRVLAASVGVGVSYRLEEGLAFASTGADRTRVEQNDRSVRWRAQARAARALVAIWRAERLLELATRRKAETKQRMDRFGMPRYAMGAISSSALFELQEAHTRALRELWSRRTEVENARSALGALDVPQQTLQAFVDFLENAAPSRASRQSQAVLRAELARAPELRAAEASQARAQADTFLAFLSMFSPITAFVESRPEHVSTDAVGPGSRSTEHAGGVYLVSSLVVPVNLRALGLATEAAFEIRVRSAELAAWRRAVSVWARERSELLRVRQAALQAASARVTAATEVVRALGTEYRDPNADASLERVTHARDDAFAAEQALINARAALFELAAEIAVLAHAYGQPSEKSSAARGDVFTVRQPRRS